MSHGGHSETLIFDAGQASGVREHEKCIGVRLSGTSKLGGLPHFTFALLLATGLTRLVTNPADANMDLAPSWVLTIILTLIIDGVAVATDKADLLSRLDDN